MKRTCNKLMLPFIGVLLVLSACTNQQGAINGEQGVNNTEHHMDVSTNHDRSGDVIPSADRTKKMTTNEDGEVTSGMGKSVYSLIGSSGIHDGGISSHLESRLSGEGIPGIKVFVLDDTIILARAKPENTSTHYDDMQNQVLTGTEGMSGKGEEDGVKDIDYNVDDNLDHAKRIMEEAFGGQVQILTVTNSKAPVLIDKIKENLKNKTPSYNQLTNDINTLVQMTKEKS
ncbi:hypothetical protein [Metabacillus arenae]|uniref:YhcN/YlaJ family sporulation lipoprotein n=1 Tax=Metabacillus arenae TaxID=2771434 RepID=A0A926NNU7_9BACI|nr:hypothetical protein [Metabacillus arenae]MBD1383348.1 hypothetical protein [Metabacillus arenae]